jgi:hypothetical protein
LVERDLAKVEVAGSSPVFRSAILPLYGGRIFFYTYPGGGTGRRAGLKILSAEMRVRVRFPSGVLFYFHTVTQQTLKAAAAPALVAFSFF